MSFRTARSARLSAFIRGCLIALIAGVSAACSDAQQSPTARPTLTLIPATATPTHTPLPPTPEPDLTPTAELLLASTLTVPTPTSAAAGVSGLAATDPIAAELVLIAQRVVASDLDLPVRRVRLVTVEPYQWTDSSLGCPLPDTVYVPVISDGYRIVLEVGETRYYFHTDFDRVLPCPEGSERLPDPEATEQEQPPAATPTPELVG
ncbi:hypothetical protein FBR02_01280 [Anaerolineae bacterium CFX9]|nr:hypothetical protein [Kamptonema cortianum]MDL1899385.1 hypothetical protein [Anaerolineae bacterium CFX9]